MKLRESLIPNVTPEKVELIKSKIQEIERRIEHDDVDKLLEEFFHETGKTDYDLEYFRQFHSFETLDEFALKAAIPKANKVEDLTKEELTWIVERIIEGDKHNEYYLELLKENVPDPDVSDLIFWPSQRGFDRDLSAKEVVENALKYKPTNL